MTKRTILILGLLLVLQATTAAAGNEGFLYGTVKTDEGNTYKGFLRWGTEETFWGDHFNSTKEDLEYARRAPRKRESIEIFGVTISYRDHDHGSGRVLALRYGDIAEIAPRGGDRAKVKLKNGDVLDLDGGSNDLGASITVFDESLGEVKLRWRDIDLIEFSAAPSGAEPPAQRLYGKLTARDETYEGFIQWDLQECLTTDELDGESDDGDLAIEMGRIKTIEKNNRRGAWVELWDGRRILLEDTNDVDRSNDGIFVEDPRYGRVEIGWDAFERLDFEKVESSGPSYGDFKPAKPLTGKVTDRRGEVVSGKIVFDLDEAHTWEILHGYLGDDVQFHIPFEIVRSVEPVSDDGSLVVLKNGDELVLEDTQDVSESNAGVIVVTAGGEDVYIEWDDVERIDFD